MTTNNVTIGGLSVSFRVSPDGKLSQIGAGIAVQANSESRMSQIGLAVARSIATAPNSVLMSNIGVAVAVLIKSSLFVQPPVLFVIS